MLTHLKKIKRFLWFLIRDNNNNQLQTFINYLFKFRENKKLIFIHSIITVKESTTFAKIFLHIVCKLKEQINATLLL